MVKVKFKLHFRKAFSKIKDSLVRKKVHKQLGKIISNPKVGKPMKHSRKGSREVYISPLRLSYKYIEEENLIIFLDLYHKDEQ